MSLDGLEKAITGHKVDDITDKEAEKIITCGGEVNVSEFFYYNLKRLSSESFGSDGFRMVNFDWGNHDIDGQSGDNRRNNLYIEWYKKGRIADIFKSEDDMFFVKLEDKISPVRFFVCDQVDGLLSMLKEMVT